MVGAREGKMPIVRMFVEEYSPPTLGFSGGATKTTSQIREALHNTSQGSTKETFDVN